MCRRLYLLVYYLLTSQAAFHTGGLFLCVFRAKMRVSASLPQAAAPSTTGGCINSPVSIDRMGGIYKLLSLLTLAAVSAARRTLFHMAARDPPAAASTCIPDLHICLALRL